MEENKIDAINSDFADAVLTEETIEYTDKIQIFEEGRQYNPVLIQTNPPKTQPLHHG